MSFATGLLCRECGATYPSEARYSCDFCFGPWRSTTTSTRPEAVLTRESIANGPNSIWRYGALLPDPGVEPVDLGAGWTPLRRSTRLAEVLGVRELWLKDDTRNPPVRSRTAGLGGALERASSRITTAACASTGKSRDVGRPPTRVDWLAPA